MSRERKLFDTNVIIRHRLPVVSGAGLLSAVVLQELAAGARDTDEVRRLGTVRAQAAAQEALVTPDGEDWWFAGKVLHALHHGLRSHCEGLTPAISKEEQQRLVRDVLIARSAKRTDASVVTYNLADFEKIGRFCDVRLREPADVL